MKIKSIIFIILIFLIAGFMLKDIFSEGALTKSDNPVHVVEAEYLAQNLIKETKWINGWYHNEFAGIPIQMYYYQIPLILVALLNLVGIEIILAYKLIIILAIALPSIALFFLIKKHFGLVPSVVTSIAFLFQGDLLKLSLAGMWANLIAFAFFIYFYKKLTDTNFGLTRINALKLGLLYAILILIHPFFAIAGLYLIAIYFFLNKERLSKKSLLNFIILLTAFLISLFYTSNFLLTSSWLNPGSGWGLGDSIGTTLFNLVGIFFSLKPHRLAIEYLLSFNLLFFKEFIISIVKNFPMLLINSLAIFGLIKYAKEKNDKVKKFLKVTIYYIIISLIIGSGFWYLFDFGSKIPFLNGILAYRFVYYARLGLFIFAAYSLKDFIKINLFSKNKVKIYSIFSLLFLALLLVGLYTPPTSYTETFSEAAIYDETLEMWSWLEDNIEPNKSRIFNENFFDNIDEPLITKDSILPALASRETGLMFFGSWYTTVYPIEEKAKTENGMLFGKKYSEITEEELKENFEAYNIKYAIAISEKLKQRFDNAYFLERTKSFENYAVYEFEKYEESWIMPNENINYNIEFKKNKIVLDIENLGKSKNITLKSSYHPYWTARINDEALEIRQNKFYLINFEIPPGKNKIILVYKAIKPYFLIISLFSFILILILLNNKIYKTKNKELIK